MSCDCVEYRGKFYVCPHIHFYCLSRNSHPPAQNDIPDISDGPNQDSNDGYERDEYSSKLCTIIENLEQWKSQPASAERMKKLDQMIELSSLGSFMELKSEKDNKKFKFDKQPNFEPKKRENRETRKSYFPCLEFDINVKDKKLLWLTTSVINISQNMNVSTCLELFLIIIYFFSDRI